MTPLLRERLNIIDGWLQEEGEGRDLAFVLSALRGPDISSGMAVTDIKMMTTAAIRSAAFPGLYRRSQPYYEASRGNGASIWSMADPANFSPGDRDVLTVGHHFADHVAAAAMVLGLPNRNAQ